MSKLLEAVFSRKFSGKNTKDLTLGISKVKR